MRLPFNIIGRLKESKLQRKIKKRPTGNDERAQFTIFGPQIMEKILSRSRDPYLTAVGVMSCLTLLTRTIFIYCPLYINKVMVEAFVDTLLFAMRRS